jgi:hypothetical protein
MYSKNYMKKIGSLALAGVMAFSLAIPAFAVEGETEEGEKKEETSSSTTAENTTVVDTKYQKVEIEVTVPTTGSAQINPYGLPVEVMLKDGKTAAGKITGQQITTAPIYVTNDGDVALTMGATVTGKATEGVSLLTKANARSTTKDVVAQVQVVAAPDTVVGAATGIDDLAIKAFIDEDNWEGASSVAVSTTATTNDNLVTLAAMTKDKDDNELYAEGGVALVRLNGTVTESPATPWAETDGFTTTIAFSFKPAAEE